MSSPINNPFYSYLSSILTPYAWNVEFPICNHFFSLFRNGEDRWAASIILLFSDIIDTRFSIITNQVPTCSAFKVAAEEATETPVSASAIQLNEFLSDMLSGR